MEPGTTYIVKRGRRAPEPFSAQKLEHSLVAACMAVETAPGQAEMMSRRVVQETEEWLKNRPEVKSEDIRRIAGRALQKYHPDAGYLYMQHHHTL